MLIGSTLGAAVGTIVIQLFPDLGLSPVVFAMVGTAAMLAGSFHAPIFGALLIFEMAGSYEMLVPARPGRRDRVRGRPAVPAGLGLHDRAPRPADLPRGRDVPEDHRPDLTRSAAVRRGRQGVPEPPTLTASGSWPPRHP